jgi:hypothetical protein
MSIAIPPISPLNLHGVRSDNLHHFLLRTVMDCVEPVGRSHMFGTFVGFVSHSAFRSRFCRKSDHFVGAVRKRIVWTFRRERFAGNARWYAVGVPL